MSADVQVSCPVTFLSVGSIMLQKLTRSGSLLHLNTFTEHSNLSVEMSSGITYPFMATNMRGQPRTSTTFYHPIMSFQDIEAGQAVRSASLFVPQSREDADFKDLQHSLSLQQFKMNANVQGILKLVDQLGTPKDSANLRKTLHDLTESTRAMAKRGSEDLKQLSNLQSTLPNQKTALQKISHDFQISLVAFQRAQQVSAEKQRTVVQGVKLAVEDEYHDTNEPEPSQEQRQAQILQSQLSPHELAYQESLIQEREAEIREIETGIHELAEIFQDLGTLVNQQGTMIDNIELNISSVAADTGAAAEELTTAAEYQRKAGRRAACLILILAIVVAVVLLAILS